MDLFRHKDVCLEIVENAIKEFTIERSINYIIKVRILRYCIFQFCKLGK